MIWHLFHGMTLWTIWVECNDKVFNQERWHESKVKYLIWDDPIMYAEMAWARVVKFVKISISRPKLSLRASMTLGLP